MIQNKQILRGYPRVVWGVGILILFLSLVSSAGMLFIHEDEVRSAVANIACPAINYLAAFALWLPVLYSKNRSKKYALGWGLLAVGQLSYAIGDTLWGVYETILGISPYPSLADGFYLLNYLLTFAGMQLIPAKRTSKSEFIKHSLDIGIIMISSILVYWVLLIGPLLERVEDVGSLEKFLTLAYPVGDLLLFLTLLIIIYHRVKTAQVKPLLVFALGMMVTIAVDTIYSFQSVYEIYFSGHLLDIAYIASYVIYAFAGLTQVVSNNHPAGIINRKRLSFKSFDYMPYFSVAAAYLLLFHAYQTSDENLRFQVLMSSVALIISLVIIRQIIVIKENDHLLGNLRNALDQVKEQAHDLDRTNENLRLEIHERARLESTLSYSAMHDSLTGLANRALFIDHLQHALDSSRRKAEYQFAVLFLDLDNFKVINDRLGHTTGDDTLIEVGKRLRGCVRSVDTVARFGGDEFVVLLDHPKEAGGVSSFAERIMSELAVPFHLRGEVHNLSCSIGIVKGVSSYSSPEDIVRDVDIAMYRAKESGKAHYEVFTVEMRTAALHRIEMENQLRKALEHKEFIVFYQPIYSLLDGAIVGVEALVRWNHPECGLLLPGEFIDVAEKSGLITGIGEYVLFEACSQLKKWHHIFPNLPSFTVDVNISGKQINQEGFIEKVKEAITTSGVDPRYLTLEITETTFIESQNLLNGDFQVLRDQGVGFMVDDFGTGYSSFGYIKNFPVGTIKIDKSFVRDIETDEKTYQIVKAIVMLAKGLKMETIAEGIETEGQLGKLRSMSCKFGQGFLLSKPMTAENLEALLKKQTVF